MGRPPSLTQQQQKEARRRRAEGETLKELAKKAPPKTWPFHVLLSVPLEPEQIERIGAREGWRAKTFGRGMQGQEPFFHVIEFWLENRLMVEVVSPAMAREYEDFLKNAQLSVMNDPESLRRMRATHVKEPA
jgi:hypothetical protein